MELKLAENIRFFRKNKKMTQEQLAESLGVTVGAVSKWESAMTTPEISMIMRLAEFFDTSMDVLVGYHLQNKSLPQIMEQLKELRQQKEYDDAISLGEKALQKTRTILIWSMKRHCVTCPNAAVSKDGKQADAVSNCCSVPKS